MSTYFTIISCVLMLSIILISVSNYYDIFLLLEFSVSFCIVSLIILLFSFLILALSIKDKNFINKQFNTNYTTEDMFWNGDDIKTMLIGKKIRIDN